MELHEIKKLFTTKEMVSKLKRPSTKWKKNLCQLYIKGLITRIYKELKKLKSPQINEPIKKWVTELNRTFSREEVQIAKKTHEK
jgi:murein L,D-transpeptidase YafK